MNKYAVSVLVSFLFLVVSVAVYDSFTGNVVIEKDPCRLIECNRFYGFWQLRAEQVGITPEGMAICHCPYDPPELVYMISHYRKY